MQLSEQQLQDLAQELDNGMIAYVSRADGNIDVIPEPDNPYAESSDWQKQWDFYAENLADYLVLRPISSREAFRVMEAFAEEVDNPRWQQRLFDALGRSRPFRRFSDAVDDSPYRQAWFAFRDQAYADHYRREIESELRPPDAE